MKIILTFTPILIAASWALYNIFFLIKKSILLQIKISKIL
uniref:Photosystem II protein Y n=1 Tax=Mallomonas splendens TaxID=52552 RepID=A0A3G2QZN2_9STRA|nr:photosystem II protein Y [Mallomonas splendens]AYO28608.1 photosystem II protein Y [Mallomonas splendens]